MRSRPSSTQRTTSRRRPSEVTSWCPRRLSRASTPQTPRSGPTLRCSCTRTTRARRLRALSRRRGTSSSSRASGPSATAAPAAAATTQRGYATRSTRCVPRATRRASSSCDRAHARTPSTTRQSTCPLASRFANHRSHTSPHHPCYPSLPALLALRLLTPRCAMHKLRACAPAGTLASASTLSSTTARSPSTTCVARAASANKSSRSRPLSCRATRRTFSSR